MGIIKHIASKNADYGAAEKYLLYQHDEFTNKPILDEQGRMILRDNFLIDGLNCTPDTFAIECIKLNKNCGKNQNRNEVKSHHYILSFDPRDRDENGLTPEKAQALGLEYAKTNFPGFQALVCTHEDGHNGSGNIHVHIVINSLRKFDVERQDYMERPTDNLAGYKHHVSDKLMIHLKQETMELCQRENLYQVDLLSPAKVKVTEQEYWAKRRGQDKLDQTNATSDPPDAPERISKFETQKDILRKAITSAMVESHSIEDFKKILLQQYGIIVKESRGRYSYLHPDRTKPITGKKLGTDFEKEFIENFIKQNRSRTVPTPQTKKTGKRQVAAAIAPRLITDLNRCIKAQQNPYYAQKVKVGNLKELARTVAYLQDNGIFTTEALEAELSKCKSDYEVAHERLTTIQGRIKEVNLLIKNTGQYFANKSAYDAYRKSRNKSAYMESHRAEITLFEAARDNLQKLQTSKKLPSLKMLKEEKAALTQEKNQIYETYSSIKAKLQEMQIITQNVDAMLHYREEQEKQKKSHDIS